MRRDDLTDPSWNAIETAWEAFWGKFYLLEQLHLDYKLANQNSVFASDSVEESVRQADSALQLSNIIQREKVSYFRLLADLKFMLRCAVEQGKVPDGLAEHAINRLPKDMISAFQFRVF